MRARSADAAVLAVPDTLPIAERAEELVAAIERNVNPALALQNALLRANHLVVDEEVV